MADYFMILDQGTVTRRSDSLVVAPCQSTEDLDFIAYQEWVTAGNIPDIYETEPIQSG